MQDGRGQSSPGAGKSCCVVSLLAFLRLQCLDNDGAKADVVGRTEHFVDGGELLSGGRPMSAWQLHALVPSVHSNEPTIVDDFSGSPTGTFAHSDDGPLGKFVGDDVIGAKATGHGGSPPAPRKKKPHQSDTLYKEQERAMTEKMYSVWTHEKELRKYRSLSVRRLKGKEYQKEGHQPQHGQMQKPVQPLQRERRCQHQKLERPMLRLTSAGGRSAPQGRLHLADDTKKKSVAEDTYEEKFMGGAKQERADSFSVDPDLLAEDSTLQAAAELAEFLVRRRAAEVLLGNDWQLIEDSWKRAELLHNNDTAFVASGFQADTAKDGRTVIRAVLPFWKVDPLGALQDMARAAAWHAFGVPKALASSPLRLKAKKRGKDTVLELGYYPSWRHDTYSFGWNGTQITYATGVLPGEAWSLEKLGGEPTASPSGHLIEVRSGGKGGKAVYDVPSRFYGQELSVGDVGISIAHQFYHEKYNATPSTLAVGARNYSVNVAADPTDTNYRVGVGNGNTQIAVMRDFDERKTTFNGGFSNWELSWDADAQDANNSTASADAFVASENQETLVAAHMHREEDADYPEADTEIRTKDLGLRLRWKEGKLTGDVSLGNINYKFDLKEGLPNFVLTT